MALPQTKRVLLTSVAVRPGLQGKFPFSSLLLGGLLMRRVGAAVGGGGGEQGWSSCPA